MAFCHEWLQAGDGKIWAMRLSEDLRKAAGEPRLLFRASEAEWAVEMRHSSGKTGFVTDGPFFWRTDDGKLLCLWSSFSAEGYTQAVAVSDTGRIDSHFSQRKPLFMKNKKREERSL